MSNWARGPECREQMVLFATRLDDVLPTDHTVRLLDEILGRLDWAPWEAVYHGRLGQPPIHPRVLAGVILYGLLKRIRSSRSLEEALEVRLDFRWLAEGRSIDHTTLSEFRRRHADALKDLFVQVGLIARQLNLLPLEQLAYDGTRLRANSRRSSIRTPESLRRIRGELAVKFAKLEQRIKEEDARADQATTDHAALPQELADTERRLAQVDAALAELKRVEAAGETVPRRIPLTDPQSRMTPNKDGGFSPNYTPLATVDMASGIIVAQDVIAMTDEEHYLVAQVEQVQESFGLEKAPSELLADGMMPTGDNLQQLQERGVTLYAPVKGATGQENPASRDDPTQALPASEWERLPVKKPGKGRPMQLTKAAFVYDAQRNCYWCPLGKALTPQHTTSERNGMGRREQRTRYKAEVSDCAACPLRDRCLQGKATRREVSRYEHEIHKEQLAERMATDTAQAKYARRREVGERPFAVIKQQFGARQFLLRGLDQVRTEWNWLTIAFNLQQLMGLIRSRAGPRPALST